MKKTLLIPLVATLAPWTAADTATAADRLWDGGDASAGMTAAANWGGNIPLNPAADDPVFPAGLPLAERTVNNNFPVGTVFRSFEFYDSGYSFNGILAGITGGIGCFHSGGAVTVTSGFTLEDTQYFTTLGAGDLTFSPTSQIYVNGKTLNLSPGNPASTITLSGFMGGAGTVNIFDGGTVALSGAKSFSGLIRILQNGSLSIDHNTSLGTAAGRTRMEEGTLILDSAAALNAPEPISMVNTSPAITEIVSKGGLHTLSGEIEMTGDYFKRFDVQGSGLAITGAITGGETLGSIVKRGPGRLTLAGSAANTAGIQIFRVGEGELLLNKSGGAAALGSPFLILGGNTGPANSAIVRLGASDQIPDITDVQVSSDGWFDLNGKQETITQLRFLGSGQVTTGAGTLRLGGNLMAFSAAQQGGTATVSGNLILQSANPEWEVFGGNSLLNLTVSGPVSSAAEGGSLTKTGAGLLTLSGNLSIPAVQLKDGILSLSGGSPATDVTQEKGELRASGTLKNITVNGGSFSVGGVTGNADLICGSLTLAGAAAAYFTVTNEIPTGHDFIHVHGTVNLNSPAASLSLVLPSLALGQEVVLIENDGGDAVSGQFKNLPEGSLINTQYVVSYQGGDGNDVSVTRIVPPTGVTRLWDGGGGDNNWMTAGNWNPNGVPEAGDDLFFPTSASRKTNLNNFPAGTTFNSISINGNDYVMGGNGITLNQKIEWTSSSASAMWGLPITLALDASLSIKGETFVQVGSNINTNGHRLTLHNAGGGDGDLYLDSISGAGGVRKTGPGKVTYFEQVSSYTGSTLVDEGTLALKADATLGSPAGGTTVKAGATLHIRNNEGDVNLNEAITLYGRMMDNGGTFPAKLNGQIIAAADTATIEVSGGMVTIFSSISGNVLHKAGTGSLLLSGTSALPLSGGLFVDAGELRLQKLSPNALKCPAVIGNANVPAKLTLAAADQLPDTGTVQIVSPGGALDLGIFTDTLGGLVMNGGTLTGSPGSRLTLGTLHTLANAATALISAPIANAGGVNGTLRIDDGPAVTDAQFDAAVSGTGFDKTGAGRADFPKDIPVEGLDHLVIKAGAALFSGSSGSTDIALDGGLLGGKGTVGAVTVLSGGTLSPGASPGVLAGGATTLQATVTLRMELNGLNAGDGYDQYAASGPPALNNAGLELAAGFDPPAGSTFMIIRNVSGAPVSGTFNNIPQNGYIGVSGGKIFQISYTGGDGDDVVLTRVLKDGPRITGFSVTPAANPDNAGNDVQIGIQGVPGILYQVESSPDLVTWKLRKSDSADLVTGLLSLTFTESPDIQRHFYRARLP
ncbi:MAG: hypothetical protein V4726_03435 [Verrucomicrobiota bacterium]